MENISYLSSLVVSNGRLVRVMVDINRPTLIVFIYRSSVEIVKSEQIVFRQLTTGEKGFEIMNLKRRL